MFSHFFSFFSIFPCWGAEREKWSAKSFFYLEQKLRSFIPFLKMKRLPETSFVAAVSTAMEGGSLSETWRGFLIILKVFRKVFFSLSPSSFHPKQRNSGVDAWEFRIDNRGDVSIHSRQTRAAMP